MKLVDAEAAAVACGKSPWTVRKAVRDGLLVNHGSGRRYEVDLDEVLQVLGDPMFLRG
ncbi:transcriptional regulator [Brachybacterium tyrofermentans]|uniref:transcriptional regulator n=1 Tax=Brachybacterium tyrofermentans TaxID=47848 RepID=UPI001868D92F|nr:transcriptional regulator [Brachybacterium tyrofermentans]